MTMADRERTAESWASRGFSCDLWVDPPGQRWEDFTHRTDEVVTVVEGTMEFEIEGKYPPSQGLVKNFLFPPAPCIPREISETPPRAGSTDISEVEWFVRA